MHTSKEVDNSSVDKEMEKMVSLCKTWDKIPGQLQCKVKEYCFKIIERDDVEKLQCLLNAGFSPTTEFKVDVYKERFIESSDYDEIDEMDNAYEPDEPNVYAGVFTALEVAVTKHGIDCVKCLLAYGVDPSKRSTQFVSPVCAAFRIGHSCEIVELLVQKGASLATNQFPLIKFALYGCLKCVQLCVDHGADLNECMRGIGGALHTLARPWYYNTAIAKLLLEHGCNVDLQDDEGNTPLAVAIQTGNLKCAELLLEHNASVNLRCIKQVLRSAFAYSGYVDCVTAVIPKLDDLFYLDDEDGSSILDIALINSSNYVHSRCNYTLEGQESFIDPIPYIRKLLIYGAQRNIFWSCHLQDLLQDPKLSIEPIGAAVNSFTTFNLDLRGCPIPEDKLKQHPDFYKKLLNLQFTPRSLQHQCRSFLTQHLNHNYYQQVIQYDIPANLKSYLLFSDPANLD